MAQSPTFRCKVCTAFHGGMHKAMCPDCAKKWKSSIDGVEKLVHSLIADPADFPGYVRKTISEIEGKLNGMKSLLKNAK